MSSVLSFFFNDTATTAIYTLSLHDALPIYDVLCAFPEDEAPELGKLVEAFDDRQERIPLQRAVLAGETGPAVGEKDLGLADRKSTRLNSSHSQISYAVFCLKKKTQYNYLTC